MRFAPPAVTRAVAAALALALAISAPHIAAAAQVPSASEQGWSVQCGPKSPTKPFGCAAVSQACTGSNEPLELSVSRVEWPNASGHMMLFVEGPRGVYARAVLQVDEKPPLVLESPACSFGYCMAFEPRGGFVDQMKWANALAVRIERSGAEPIVATCSLAGLPKALSDLPNAAAAQ